MMAIVIFYHHSGFRCFKYYYQQIVQKAFNSYFPHSYSYSRFVNRMKELNLFVLLTACRMATTTEGNYIDATKLVVSHNKGIPAHKRQVFYRLASNCTPSSITWGSWGAWKSLLVM
jgi:hypothetical protein